MYDETALSRVDCERMAEDESELAMVQRHVRQGAEIVTRQRELLARLQANGHQTEEAEALLHSFEDTQREHEEHLARLSGYSRSGCASKLAQTSNCD